MLLLGFVCKNPGQCYVLDNLSSEIVFFISWFENVVKLSCIFIWIMSVWFSLSVLRFTSVLPVFCSFPIFQRNAIVRKWLQFLSHLSFPMSWNNNNSPLKSSWGTVITAMELLKVSICSIFSVVIQVSFTCHLTCMWTEK